MNHELLFFLRIIALVVLISYLIYPFINREFLAFTLSKDYWVSLFLGIFLGIFLGVFLSSVGIRIVENQAFFHILSRLASDTMLGVILGLIFGVIFGVILGLIFGLIFGLIKKYNRNLTWIEIKSTRKLFSVNLCFMMFSSMFLIFSLGGSIGAQLMLIVLVGFLKGW